MKYAITHVRGTVTKVEIVEADSAIVAAASAVSFGPRKTVYESNGMTVLADEYDEVIIVKAVA